MEQIFLVQFLWYLTTPGFAVGDFEGFADGVDVGIFDEKDMGLEVGDSVCCFVGVALGKNVG